MSVAESGVSVGAQVSPVRFEHMEPPWHAGVWRPAPMLGVGTPTPRLSWQVTTDDADWTQTAYELELDGRATVRVDSDEQVLRPWPFEPLASRRRATVRVRSSCNGRWTGWSEPASVEAGLLSPEDWRARFVSPRTLGGLDAPAPVLARTVTLEREISAARLYMTARGVYVATLNGARVGDEVLAPGWSSYQHRLCYQTHDVTSLLRQGENRLEVLLGNGWYRGRLTWGTRRACYGDRLALLAQLEVVYADGSTEVIGTDERWSATESGIRHDDIYDGQRTDLRPVTPRPDAVDVLDVPSVRLVAAQGPPVRETEVLPAISTRTSPAGATIVDFGQNLVGWVRLRVRGAVAGTEVVVRHAEVLESGELGVRPLRSAKATDSYVLDDAAEVTLEPSLTFHGFRYAEITGVPDVRAADVEAVVVGTDLWRTGWFDCSDPELTRFHDNVVWSMRGNFLAVPTDCPQRDERLGWTGDIQVFSPAAGFLFDVAGFLSSWLDDLAAEQYRDGSVPFVVPDVLTGPRPAHDDGVGSGGDPPVAAAWGDAAVVLPWVLYQRFGDAEVLARQFASMRGWVDKVASLRLSSFASRSLSGGLRAGGFQFGDWLDPDAPPDDPFAAKADPDLVATACLARCARIVADAATVLADDDRARHYASLADEVRAAFARAYVTDAGRVIGDCATSYAIALQWDLLPSAAQREGAAARLADLVVSAGFRVSTGFVGTPLVTDALASSGYGALAYRLLLERGCPSWLYPVTMGATTIWERWDSMLPDGSINPGQMTSFNHYALGAVADWIHRRVAGLAPAAPGYREITVAPLPDSALTHAAARHLGPYGGIAVAWRRVDGRFELDVEVPVGCRATVYPPGEDAVTVGHGRHSWRVADPCRHADRRVSTVRDLIASPRLWPRAVAVLVDAGLGSDAAAIAHRAARYLDRPARELPVLLARTDHGERVDQASAALSELLP